MVNRAEPAMGELTLGALRKIPFQFHSWGKPRHLEAPRMVSQVESPSWVRPELDRKYSRNWYTDSVALKSLFLTNVEAYLKALEILS